MLSTHNVQSSYTSYTPNTLQTPGAPKTAPIHHQRPHIVPIVHVHTDTLNQMIVTPKIPKRIPLPLEQPKHYKPQASCS